MKAVNNGAVGPAENKGLIKPITLNDAVVKLLNERLGDEYAAHYFYNSAANWCAGVGYQKAAKFFADEAVSELGHALKLQKYLVDWNCTPTIPTVPTFADFGNLQTTTNSVYIKSGAQYTLQQIAKPTASTVDVGTYVTDVSINPYLKPKAISFVCVLLFSLQFLV